MLNYADAIRVTQSSEMIVFIVLMWAIPLLLFIATAIIYQKKTSSGSHKLRPLITSNSLGFVLLYFGLIGLFLAFLYVFPLFLRIPFLKLFFPN
jgi:nitrate/nitrite transporter NarK